MVSGKGRDRCGESPRPMLQRGPLARELPADPTARRPSHQSPTATFPSTTAAPPRAEAHRGGRAGLGSRCRRCAAIARLTQPASTQQNKSVIMQQERAEAVPMGRMQYTENVSTQVAINRSSGAISSASFRRPTGKDISPHSPSGSGGGGGSKAIVDSRSAPTHPPGQPTTAAVSVRPRARVVCVAGPALKSAFRMQLKTAAKTTC